MKHIARIILFFLLLLCLSVAAAVMGVRILLPPAKAARYAVAMVRGYVGQTLTLEGFDYGFGGIVIERLSLSDPGRPAAPPWLALSSVRIVPLLGPLRARVTGTAGDVSFEAVLRRPPGTGTLRVDRLVLRTPAGVIESSGVVRNTAVPELINFSFTVDGDQAALDHLAARFPQAPLVRFGPGRRVRALVEGTRNELTVRRRP